MDANAEAVKENLLAKKTPKDKVDAVTGENFKASQLTESLGGTLKQRIEMERTVTVSMYSDRRQPEVVFTGFWTGKFIKGAINAIGREMRHRRMQKVGILQKEAKGDG